jgi:hypothetical protein
MIKLLDEADEAISNSQVGMYYYVKVPELTEEDFLSRQDIPSGGLQEDDLTIAKESLTHRNGGPMTADITVKDNNLPNSVSTVEQSLGILSPDKELMEQLVIVIRQILWSFLPKTGSSTVHKLLKRFWGCMDIIRRVRPHHSTIYSLSY